MVKELTTIEELDAYLRLMDEWTYSEVATNLYLLLRQWVGDPWRHGVDVNAIDIHTREPLNVGRHRALFDRRWVFDEKVDTDTWHATIVRVLEWLQRGDTRTEGMTYRLLDDEPGVVQWLRHFTVNTRRRLWRHNKEYPVGSPEGYVAFKDDPEKTKEVPPPKGFQPPEPHSWRYEYLAHDPWEGLDLRADLRRALAKLPPVDRALFIRHHAEDEPVLALAAECGLPNINRAYF
jgi:hypothetical protein